VVARAGEANMGRALDSFLRLLWFLLSHMLPSRYRSSSQTGSQRELFFPVYVQQQAQNNWQKHRMTVAAWRLG
jgi:hypothetical protein